MRSVQTYAMATAVLAGGLSLIAAQQAAPRRDPLVRENATQKVSDHVYVIPDNSVPLVPNVGIMVGDRAVLVVDTGMGNRNGATVLHEAQEIVPYRACFSRLPPV